MSKKEKNTLQIELLPLNKLIGNVKIIKSEVYDCLRRYFNVNDKLFLVPDIYCDENGIFDYKNAIAYATKKDINLNNGMFEVTFNFEDDELFKSIELIYSLNKLFVRPYIDSLCKNQTLKNMKMKAILLVSDDDTRKLLNAVLTK